MCELETKIKILENEKVNVEMKSSLESKEDQL